MNSTISSMNWLDLLRWTARILSIISAGMLLLFILGEEFNPAKITAREWIGLLFFPIGVVIGLIVGWWREGTGGAITIFSLLAFYLIFGWLLNHEWLGGWFIVFAAPGFLFFIYWLLTRPQAGQTGLTPAAK